MFDDNGSFLLATLEFFIFLAWFMCLFWIFGDLFRSKDLGGWGKTLWTLFLIFLPVIAMLVYLIARGNGMTERAMAHQVELQQRQEAYIRQVSTATPARDSGAAGEIAAAKELLDAGTISAAEFEQLKSSALRKTPATA
ncbi:PLD nuclease N-terminal domain-containing protein [Actinoplanes oblitus]|uniref:PLD nuclease N-terminal domain-containing protein n=1 Tax=Actinoplanes oblitus TaxID=3040509 RepID=A0ABY8W923_9ACTN|nr:PLD nuclease N-terminal domain-containing protein [Actinoplanes oblitus]WIM94341.1 PLD nuclease N-terminal domain-containing protein [Actinoplanes oblitus]